MGWGRLNYHYSISLLVIACMSYLAYELPFLCMGLFLALFFLMPKLILGDNQALFWIRFFLCMGVVFCVMWGRYLAETQFDALPYGVQTSISIRFIEAPQHYDQYWKGRVYIDEWGVEALVSAPQRVPVSSYGQRCMASGRLERVDGVRNPGQFDYRRYLHTHGVSGKFYLDSLRDCTDGYGNPLKTLAIFTRKRVHQVVRRYLDPPYSELFLGLLFGQHGVHLPKDMQTRFRIAGLTHLLVVSGSQISLISGVLLSCFRLCKVPKYAVFGIMILVHSVFYIMTGGGASILRAILMFDFMLLMTLQSRRPFSVHVAAVTLLLMMVWNPLIIEDLGAQLSFLATFSLISIAPIIRDKLPNRWPDSVREVIGVSTAPFLLTSPLIWHAFHVLSPYSVLANAVLMAMVEWLVTLGFITTFLGVFVPMLAAPYFNLCYVMMLVIDMCATLVEKVPFSILHLPAPPVWVLFWLYGGILWWCFRNKDPIFNGVTHYVFFLFRGKTLCVVLCCCFLWWRFSPQPLKLWFLDVGQGDSVLIQTPKRRTILIDAGVKQYDYRTGELRLDMGQRVVVPVLDYLGISRIDLAIVSHMDMDHVGGMPFVFSKKDIGLILDNGNYPKDPSYMDMVHQYNIPRHTAQIGQRIPIEADVFLTILHPGPNQNQLSENDQSVVVLMEYKGQRFLFTGDLEKDQERSLVRLFSNRLDVDLLKVGHHGSRTSSTPELLDATTPDIAVIQSGRRNRYGHPNKVVLERFNSRGINVLRTDQNGAVYIESDGEDSVVNQI